MDWTIPLRSQQADFIERLKSGHLLHSETEGQHSELTVISGERLKQLRAFCWEMAEKYKRTSPVRDVFINNMKGKLGEEVVKARLGNLVTEVDYEKRLGGDGKVDFTLSSNFSVGVQVKACHGNIDTLRWSISVEEAEKNAVLVCILIQEEVSEAQTQYHLVLAGFLPTNIIQPRLNAKNSTSLRSEDLLYGGGLRSYLKGISEPIKCLRTLVGHSSSVNSVAISPNGKFLVSGSSDQTIKIWNLNTGKLIRTITGNSQSVHCVTIDPDGQTLASSGWENTIKIWNLETGELLSTRSGESYILSIVFLPDRKRLLSGGLTRDIFTLWTLCNDGRDSSYHGVYSVAISPDGRKSANGRTEGIIEILSIYDYSEEIDDSSEEIDDSSEEEYRRILVGHSGLVRSVAFSPDGQLVVSGSMDKTIKIWNPCTGELLRTLTGHSDSVNSIAISPDSQIIASGSWDKTIKIWNLYTGKLLQTLSEHSGGINSIAISPDGQILASGSSDHTIKIWQLEAF